MESITYSVDSNVINDAASAVTPSMPTVFSKLTHSAHLVGPAWVISSAILTTYSTTSFLKYGEMHSGKGKEGDIQSTGASMNFQENQKQGKFYSNHKTEASQGDLLLTHKSEAVIPLPLPILLTLYRFSGSLLLGLIMQYKPWRIMGRIRQTWLAARDFALPALFLFIANYSNSISLDRIGISLTYTSKCGIPLITVLLTLIMDGPKAMPSVPTLLSLIPIAAGIALASWNSPTFESVGFAAAFISSTAQAALNVSSKRVMSKTHITGADAQRAMVAVAFLITTAVSVLDEVFLKWKATVDENMEAKENSNTKKKMPSSTSSIPHMHPPVGLSIMAVVAYHIEYVLSFMFVKLVEPITYGTCDAIRRLLIIISGQKMFRGDPFSKLNLVGIGLALAGALLYSILSYTTV